MIMLRATWVERSWRHSWLDFLCKLLRPLPPVCFKCGFTDIGLIVRGVTKADDLSEHFPVPISEIQVHQWTNWSDQPKIVVGLQLAIGCGYFVVAGRRLVGT